MAKRSAAGLWVGRHSGDTGGGGTPAAPPPIYVAPPSLDPGSYVVYVGDREGVIIGELAGALESVVWAADGYGTAALVLPTDAPSYAHLLQYGNRALIDFSNGLPLWGGVIDPPRETRLGQTRVQLYEAAYTLSWDWTGEAAAYAGDRLYPAAQVLAGLVRDSHLDIAIDPLAADGERVSVQFNNESLLSAAEKLRGLEPRLHYRVRAEPLRGQRIQFALQAFYDALEDDTGRALLIQGQNLIDWQVLEQGPIWNEVTAASQSEAAADGRFVATATAPASQMSHGLRREPVALAGLDEDATPGQTAVAARARVAALGEPRLRARGMVLNQEPGLYRSFGIGSRVAVEISRPTTARLELLVIGMEYVPSSGVLSLTFDDGDRVGV